MNSIFRKRSMGVALLCLACVGSIPVALGQEEAPVEEPSNRLGNIYIEFDQWVAQPVGLDQVPATEQRVIDTGTGTFTDTRELEVPYGTEAETRYQVEYRLPSEYGSFVVSVYKHTAESALNAFAPSEFVFGETLTHDLFAGYRNDSLSDGFASASSARLRDVKLEFRRNAFRRPRIAADWFVGWQRVQHRRELAAAYFALVPDLPPVLPPSCDIGCPNLTPELDLAVTSSDFEGRGVTVGIDLEFPLWKNQLVFEGGASIGVLRGNIDASIEGSNSYFVLDGDPVTILCATPASCDADYELFDDTFVNQNNQTVYVADSIEQRTADMVAAVQGESRTAQTMENYLGFRWRTPYKRLEVFAGIRQARYDDVALELRPIVTSSAPNANGQVNVNVTGLTEKNGSVTYEGFYGGLTFRLY